MKRFIPIACRGALVLGAGLLCRAPGANAIGFGVRTDLGYDSFTQSNTRDSALERAPFGGFGYALDAEIVPLRIDDLRVLTQVGFRGVLLEKEGSENGVTTTATFKSFLLGFDVGAGYEFMKGLQGDLLLGADYEVGS